jgi:hypothetical protein
MRVAYLIQKQESKQSLFEYFEKQKSGTKQ